MVLGAFVEEWTEERIVDGRPITVRPMHADDVDRLRRLFFRLSPETVHLRFFQPVKRPSEKMLHHLAEVDHEQRQAIVATDETGEIVAVARYDRLDGTDDAETAIVVEDAWQGHGVGKLLLRRLTVDALHHGIHTLTATALGENRRVLGLVHDIAPAVHTHLDHGEWYLDIPLDQMSVRPPSTAST